MHIMIVNFHLQHLAEADYMRACEQQIAAAFRAVPGLVSKIWLRNAETNTYGGVYVWESRRAMENFRQSELGQSVGKSPHFAGVTMSDFDVLEAPTRITNGMPVMA
ncbi:MAG: YdhR family protein [Acidobacteriota bacterium]